MKTINILVLQENSAMKFMLDDKLASEGYTVTGVCSNAEEARTLFYNNDIDIIVLNINTAVSKPYLDIAFELLNSKPIPLIYFSENATFHTTNYNGKPFFKESAFLEFATSYYSTKKITAGNHNNTPIAKHHHPNVTSSNNEIILQHNNAIFIKFNYTYVKINYPDLLYVEADGNNINIFTKQKKYLLRLSLTQFSNKIIHRNIVQIHRSYLVNMDSITSFDDQSIFIHKIEIPIGRNYKSRFYQQFSRIQSSLQ